METLKAAKEGIAAESDQMEGLIQKFTDASRSAFNALRQSQAALRSR